MQYRYFRSDAPLRDKILASAGIGEDDLRIERYGREAIPEVESFKEKLLSHRDKRFFIVGDYDCDGITATAILKRLLDHLGISSNYYLPSRLKEGYGINEHIVRTAKENGFDVLLTADNGVVAHEAIKLAHELGMEVFVLDHHEYEKEPDVEAFLHPQILPEGYRKLCAGGLSYLLSSSFYNDELSLVYGGLATQADMVGVLGYNRYLLKEMLKILNRGNIYQINALSGKNSYTYDDLSFSVIPKINAVSRLGFNVNMLVKYLLADETTCLNVARQIDQVNRRRQDLTKEMAKKAEEKADARYELMIVKDPSFQEGLCGLIANRLLYTYHKPVLVLSEEEGELKGSGRSIPGFHLHDYLKGFEYFTTFGGHDSAVGLSLKGEDYPKLLEYIASSKPVYEEVIKEVIILEDDDVRYEAYKSFEDLRPFGVDFPEPLFALKKPEISRSFLIKGLYPKYSLRNGLEAISFDMREIREDIGYMIGHLQKDRYRHYGVSFLIEELQ